MKATEQMIGTAHEFFRGYPITREYVREMLNAALSLLPAGEGKCEPTPEMLQAGIDASPLWLMAVNGKGDFAPVPASLYRRQHQSLTTDDCAAIYRAMRAAAPPAGEGEWQLVPKRATSTQTNSTERTRASGAGQEAGVGTPPPVPTGTGWSVEQALEPFSRMAGELFARNKHRSEVLLAFGSPDSLHRITVGDFFNARLAFNAIRSRVTPSEGGQPEQAQPSAPAKGEWRAKLVALLRTEEEPLRRGAVLRDLAADAITDLEADTAALRKENTRLGQLVLAAQRQLTEARKAFERIVSLLDEASGYDLSWGDAQKAVDIAREALASLPSEKQT